MANSTTLALTAFTGTPAAHPSPPPPLRLITQVRPEAAAEVAAAMMAERDRYRAALLWALGGDRFPAGEILLRAALGELAPGSRRIPPVMADIAGMLRLLQAMPWAREGFVVLGQDSEEWAAAGAALSDAAGLPNPWLEIFR